MKMKKSSKKIVSIVLSLTLIITSLPFMLFSAATVPYDPAPKFSDAAIKEGARAWLDDEGNIHVAYPAADAEPTYKDEELSIAFYILELVDMGPKNQAHTDTVISTVKATGTRGTFPAADIGEIDLTNNRYSVTVTAVDTQNWFSLPLYTTVTDVPVAEIDASRFANFSTSATAVREIMTFEDGTDDGAVTQGSQLLYMGVAAETGTEDLSDNIGDTSALRFIVNDQPTGTQAFDTSYSRQTWDFDGAEEMWYWLDFSKVELQGVSFRLRTNEKMWIEWKDGTVNTTQRAGETIYSTKGTATSTYTGEAPYVYVQAKDGSWDKVMMTNGTIDLSHFKGYVRVPLKFMCSETATYVDISNQEFGQKKSFTSGINNTVNEGNAFSWMRGMTFSQKVLVDNAGTPISDALLIHRRGYKTSSGFLNAGTKHTFVWNINGQTHYTENLSSYDYSKTGYMLAMPLDEDSAKTSVTTGNASTDRAYISGTTVMNREAGLKAIEDIYNAGFSFENCSADSLQNSFYVDNIFFYRSDGGAYSENTLDGNVNTGNPMSTYYDEESAISKIIFDEIDKYISDPDWADYRELEYILELIEEYKALYISQGKDITFLNLTRQPDTSGMAGMAAKLNRTDTWEKAWLAYEACASEGTIDASQANITDLFISNGDKYDLVPSIVNTMEKLPHPDKITSVSEVLRKEIVKLWQAYSLLNLGQLEMLGAEQEDTLLKYFALIENITATDGDKFVVGQRLADNPFIVFNDFENYSLGETAWQLEDNKDAYTTDFTSKNGSVAGTSNLANDWRHTKSLVTYTTNGSQNIVDADYYGYVTTDEDKSQESMDGKVYYNASTATITNEGYLHSKGVNLYSDASFTSNSGYKGTFHTVTITKDGQPIGTNYENNMVGEQLGSLAQSYSAAASTSVPLALIFYVDFTQIANFNFSINVFTRDADGNHVKCRADTGLLNADRKYWILDNETGEWEIIYTTNQYAFNSSGNQDESTNQGVEYNKIEGYRGYLMVPLYHIKVKDGLLGTSGTKLDENSALLNNIFAIQFCIGGVNATDMDEKSIIIDNVGFTYSKDSYSMASTRNDPSYAEVFEAKSLPAKNFEDAVAAIDPYDETTLSSSVQAAQTIYATLPAYQKQVVAEAHAKLQLYITYVNNPANIPQPDVSAEDVVKWIEENLDSKATGASVTGENDLIYPGFILDANNQVVPNYEAYGLTAELAATIRDFYSNSYINYSVAEKDQVNKAGFLNAYNAAMRCLMSLESIKTDALTFLPEITALYTVKYDYNDDGVLENKDENVADSDNYKIGNFISIEGRAEVETFKTDMYDPLQYYSKTSIDDGSIYPQLQNTSRGFTYFLNNTRSFTVDGEEINGGIITFRNKLQNIYDNASTKITNRERLSEDEIREIKDTLEEYNNFLPAYYNVEELYELEQKILRLFPVSEVAVFDAETGGSEVTEVSLNNDNEDSMKKTVYVDMTYIATLLESSEIKSIADVSTSVTLQAVSDLKLTQMEGTTYSSLNSFTAGSLVADTVLDLGEYDNLEPNEVFARIPFEIAVDPSVASKAPTGSVYEGSITFNVYETADIEAGLTGEDLVPMATIELPVKFTSTNGTNPISYTVQIPSDTTIDWDTTEAVDMSYTIVEANLEDSTLTVGVADADSDGNNETDMISTQTGADGNPFVLDYEEANFIVSEFTGSITTETKPDAVPTITIQEADWDAVPVGEYKTQLTYTVALEDGS